MSARTRLRRQQRIAQAMSLLPQPEALAPSLGIAMPNPGTITQQVVRPAVGAVGWYVGVSSASAVPPGVAEFVVLSGSSATGWLHKPGIQPQLVTIVESQPGGASGVLVRVTPQIIAAQQQVFDGGFSEVLAPFSQGSSVRTTAGAPVRTANPAARNPECMVDLEALRMYCPGTVLHGAEVVDVGETNGELVTVTFVDPSDGATKSGRFRVAPYQGVAWWEHDGHCCESCALGHDCDDEAA